MSMPAIHAAFRKRYGIPPRGDRNAPSSQWGFPLPPADHPQALKFAHAVLTRAHQAKDFSAKDVARQVAKAKAIVAKHNKAKKESASWRAVAWVNAAKPTRAGYSSVKPRPNETLSEFRKRVPGAMPAKRAARLNETQKAALAAYLRGRKMRESATLVRSASLLRESFTSNIAFREANAKADVVENVLLIRAGPGNKADGHYYTKECLQRAAASGIFEGAQLYLDHPDPDEERSGVRSVKYLAGWYSDIVCREYNDPGIGPTAALFGTLHPAIGNAKCLEIVRTCAEYAKRYPSKAYAGLSINALGDGEPDMIDGEQYNRVDEITECESVDIVTKAGAGGTITPLKESNRMAKKTMTAAQKIREAKRLLKEARTSRNPLDLALTVDADKVKNGVKKLAEAQKTKLAEAKKKLKEAGVQLSPEQDQALDEALGLVDGGALDKLIDEATGVSDDEADETVEDDLGEDDLGEDDLGEDDLGEDDLGEDDVEAMSHDDLKKAHKKLQAAHAELKKNKVAESARIKGLRESAERTLRESAAKGICDRLNIPDTFRGRLVDELVEKCSTAKQMLEHAQKFDKAFIRPVLDGAGSGARLNESGRKTIDFTFGEEN